MTLRTVVKMLAPRKVILEKQPLPEPDPHEVLVDTICTAVSAGTEMLVYRGEMPNTVRTDATLSHLQETFCYPIAYGYSSAGRVKRVGKSVTGFRPGDLVFGFREHASAYVASAKDLQRVPDGISAYDACLLPSVETALSVAFDAALLPGESAVVVGQGAIGLLITSVLKELHPLSTITAVERDASRRAAARTAGADAVLSADDAAARAIAMGTGADGYGFDVAIDSSGTGGGLDTAISLTRDSGRVVMASWFGAKTVGLRTLGGRFHRSHITIVASQVSEIPAILRGRWTKKRRFRLAWRLLARIRPATRLPVTKCDARDAARVYAAIDAGRYVQVIFEYD